MTHYKIVTQDKAAIHVKAENLEEALKSGYEKYIAIALNPTIFDEWSKTLTVTTIGKAYELSNYKVEMRNGRVIHNQAEYAEHAMLKAYHEECENKRTCYTYNSWKKEVKNVICEEKE